MSPAPVAVPTLNKTLPELVAERVEFARCKIEELRETLKEFDAKQAGSDAAEQASAFFSSTLDNCHQALSDLHVTAQDQSQSLTSAFAAVGQTLANIKDQAHVYDETYQLTSTVSAAIADPREQANLAIAAASSYVTHRAAAASVVPVVQLVLERIEVARSKVDEVRAALKDFDARQEAMQQASGVAEGASLFFGTTLDQCQSALTTLSQSAEAWQSGSEVPASISSAFAVVTQVLGDIKEMAHTYDTKYQLATTVSAAIADPREQATLAVATASSYATHALAAASEQPLVQLVTERVEIARTKVEEVREALKVFDAKGQATAAADQATVYLSATLDKCQRALGDLSSTTETWKSASEVPLGKLSSAFALVHQLLGDIKEMAHTYDTKYQLVNTVSVAIAPAREQATLAIAAASSYSQVAIETASGLVAAASEQPLVQLVTERVEIARTKVEEVREALKVFDAKAQAAAAADQATVYFSATIDKCQRALGDLSSTAETWKSASEIPFGKLSSAFALVNQSLGDIKEMAHTYDIKHQLINTVSAAIADPREQATLAVAVASSYSQVAIETASSYATHAVAAASEQPLVQLVAERVEVARTKVEEVREALKVFDAKGQANAAADQATVYFSATMDKCQRALGDLSSTTETWKSASEVPASALASAFVMVSQTLVDIKATAQAFDEHYQLTNTVSGAIAQPREQATLAIAAASSYAAQAAAAASDKLLGVSDGLKLRIMNAAEMGLQRAVSADERLNLSKRAVEAHEVIAQKVKEYNVKYGVVDRFMELDQRYSLSQYLLGKVGNLVAMDQRMTGGKVEPAMVSAYGTGVQMIGQVMAKYEEAKMAEKAVTAGVKAEE